jgi:threonine synthase
MLNARLTCLTCSEEASLRQEERCRSCGGSLQAQGDIWPARIDRDARDPLTRYRAFLPLDATNTSLSLGEGATPQIPARLGRAIRGGRLDLKLETHNPNSSAFDRGAIACVSRARALSFTQVLVTQSEIATSVAAYAARAGLGCIVLLPAASPPDAGNAASFHGARVIRVETTPERLVEVRDECHRATRAYSIERSDPFWIEGCKTLAYEIMEASAPEPAHHIVVPEHWQSEAAALAKGLREWQAAGLGERTPDVLIARLPRSDNGWAVSDQGFPCCGIDRREAVAAQSLLAEEDGLIVDEGQAAVVAAAIKVARSGGLQQPQRVVAVVDGTSGRVRVEPSESCTLDELPVKLAARLPLLRSAGC